VICIRRTITNTCIGVQYYYMACCMD